MFNFSLVSMVLGFVESFLRQRSIGSLMSGLGIRQPAFVCGMVYQHGNDEHPIPGCLHLSNKQFTEDPNLLFLSLGLSASQN